MAQKYGISWQSGYSVYKIENDECGEYGKYDTFQEAKRRAIEMILNDIDDLKFQLRNLRSLKEKDL